MASSSSKKSKPEENSSKNKKIISPVPAICMLIGNTPGSKSLPERRKYRLVDCFLIPNGLTENPYEIMRKIHAGGFDDEIFETDFLNFWHQLDDRHKERRLLLNYFCFNADIDNILNYHLENHSVNYNRCQYSKAIASIEKSMMPDILYMYRRYFIDLHKKDGLGDFEQISALFIGAFVDGDSNAKSLLGQFFLRDLTNLAYDRSVIGIRESRGDKSENFNMFFSIAVYLMRLVFAWFVVLYRTWSQRCSNGRRWYLGKLSRATVHWRKEDRAYLLEAIESKGESCRGTYVGDLIKDLGLEEFKLIAFGEEKFCSHCNRSSYVGEDRLWSCQRCAKERIKPKARYCNVHCQRADWLKHKSIAHASGKPKLASKKKKCFKF